MVTCLQHGCALVEKRGLVGDVQEAELNKPRIQTGTLPWSSSSLLLTPVSKSYLRYESIRLTRQLRVLLGGLAEVPTNEPHPARIGQDQAAQYLSCINPDRRSISRTRLVAVVGGRSAGVLMALS